MNSDLVYLKTAGQLLYVFTHMVQHCQDNVITNLYIKRCVNVIRMTFEWGLKEDEMLHLSESRFEPVTYKALDMLFCP